MALLGCLGCLSALTALSFALPSDREDEFYPHQYVSKFARSASVATVDLIAHGVFEADAASPGRLILGNAGRCDAGRKLPHIVMVFDESSFDATVLPDVQVPPNYAARFRSSDGKTRSFVVEGAGGPSWYTEYNVLTGLSVRSYGRFAESATRLATGRVKRGLPHALRECGYRTYSLYSWFGGFVGARGFQTTDRYRAFPRLQTTGQRGGGYRSLLLRPRCPHHRGATRQRPGFCVRLSRRQPLSLELPLSSGSPAGLGQPRKPVRNR